MGKKLDNREKKIIMIFLGIIFFTILAWALVQPFNASPDEIMRYQIVEYIIKHGKLPAGYDPEIRDPNWGISYAFNPITTYIVGAAFRKRFRNAVFQCINGTGLWGPYCECLHRNLYRMDQSENRKAAV